MYKMDLAAMQATYEMYKQKEEQLIAKKESLQTITTALTDESVWQGEDADSFRTDMQKFLDGEYQETLDKVSGMKVDLRRAAEGGRTLKAFCDDLADTLDGNSISILDEENVTGTLLLNPNLIPVITSSAKVIEEQAAEVSSLIGEIESILGSLETCKVDISEEASAIRASCRDFENIGYFGTQVSRYAEYVEDLNADLVRRFSKYVEGDTNYRGLYQCYVKGEAVNTERLTYLLSLSAYQLTDTERAEIEAMKAALKDTGDVETMMTLTDAILQQDASQWSEEEAAFAAFTWAYLMETDDVENIEQFLESLQCVEYGESTERWVEKGRKETFTPVVVSFDMAKSELILGSLDPFAQGEAYYTMNRIQIFGEEVGKKSYTLQGSQLGQERFNFEVTKYEMGMIIKMQIHAPGEREQEMQFTAMDMNEIVGIETMYELGLSDEQIVSVLSGIYYDEDAVFATGLCNAKTREEYATAFEYNPKELSEPMKMGLFNYGYALMDNGIEHTKEGIIESQDLTKYQNFINGVLAYDSVVGYETVINAMGEETTSSYDKPRYCEEYLNILIESSGKAYNLNKEIAIADYNAENIEETALVIDKELNQYALYNQLLNLYESCVMADTSYAAGLKIQNLDIDGDTGATEVGGNLHRDSFSFQFEITQGGYQWDGPYTCWMEMMTPQEAMLDEYIKEESDAIVERKLAPFKATYSVGKTVLNCCYPPAGLAVSALEGTQNAGKVVSGVVKPYVGDNPMAKNSLSIAEAIYSAGYEWYNTEKAYQEMEGTALQPYFRNAITVQTNMDVAQPKEILLNGMYTSETLLTYARFEAEGCQFLVDESVTAADVQQEIKELPDETFEKMNKNIFEGVNDEDKKNMLSLVWCNQPVAPDCTLTLKDMTSGQKAVCMQLLSEKILDSDNQNRAYLYSLFNEYEPY